MKDDIRITEVKLMLDSGAALDGAFKLADELKEHFDLQKPAEEMKIWYLDTPGQHLKALGWIVRFRYHEGCDFELTFKKRYSEQEYKDVPAETLEPLKDFKPQIDMSVSKKTYSFSCVKTFKMEDIFYTLGVDDAKRLALSGSPVAFSDWNGKGEGTKLLENSVLYGPAEAMEYKGKYAGLEASFELWKLDGFLSELSFKVDTDRSDELMNKLLDDDKIKRLVLKDGTLKTEAMFDYYKKHKELLR